MSQPRRRRRRGRRKPNRSGDANKREAVEKSCSESEDKPAAQRAGSRSRRSGRGRRGRTRGRDAGKASPKSSEDLVRGDPKRPPATLTAPHDGTTLEQVIGELQSEHGVPQHPQEYRITLKVADERGGGGSTIVEEKVDATEKTEIPPGGIPDQKPRREKAPAAPRIGSSAAEAEEPGKSASKKRRSRRRRRPRGKPGGSTT